MKNTIDFNDIYMVNPVYTIRNDVYRTIIANEKGFPYPFYKKDDISTSFVWNFHPYFAVFFSYFDGTATLNETINALIEDFKLSREHIEKVVFKVIENEDNAMISMADHSNCSVIPKRFLIKKEADQEPRKFDVRSFIIEKKRIDLVSNRLYVPATVFFMALNRCFTDCIYCYADKDHKVKKELPFERVKELIKEASEIGVLDFSIAGGDIFLYKYWRELVQEVLKYGYFPLLSTKYPISREDIRFLKQIGIEKMQISYDCDDSEKLQKILKVKPEYREQMLETFKNLEDAGISIMVKAVITKYNSEIADIKKLMDRLQQYKNILHFSIAPAEASLYKNFVDYKADILDLKKMKFYVNHLDKARYSFPFEIQGYASSDKYTAPFAEKEKKFKERSLCTANFSALYILPDGQVGICEQLYWHPDLIVGDVNKQSIMEVWNSKEAIQLHEYPQSNFPEDSVCKTCADFIRCRKVKGVCWKMIFFAYGKDKVFAPDPDCPYAEMPTQIFFHEER